MAQAQQPDALAAVIERTSLVIGLTAAAERTPWLLARCWLVLGRFEAQSRNPADLDLALADFDLLPPGYPARAKLAALLLEAHLGVATPPESDRRARMQSLCAIAGADPEPLPQWPQISAAVHAQSLAPAGVGASARPAAVATADHAKDTRTSPDPTAGRIAQSRETSPAHGPHRIRHLLTTGSTHLGSFERTGARSDLAAGISLLEQARELAGSCVHALWAAISIPLARAYRLSGHRDLGREVAVSGLRGHAWNVLLQPGAADMYTAARHAAEETLDVARMCLADDDPERAVTALDAGRGLILFAAAENRGVAARLAARGEIRLAARWRRATELAPPQEAPTELRREVLSALAGLPLDADGPASASPGDARVRLLDPPNLYEIRAALGVLGADALVYLLPGEDCDGAALLVPAGDAPSWTVLPDLRSAALTEFDRCPAARSGGARADRPERIAAAKAGPILARECDWAWRAAIGPLFSGLVHPPADRPARLVLVPMRGLAQVPWHAARYRAAGRTHYALEHAVFSYAVSARMLCESAWRGDVPLTGAGLIVSDPDTGGSAGPLPAARAEAQAIRDSFYPAARYLGRRSDDGEPGGDGVGDRAQVLAWLADPDGGRTAHFACHGATRTGPDEASYLVLAGGQRLSAPDLSGALTGTPGRDIGLAVLAACGGAARGKGHDEAFSLGTSLLANNVRSVISAMWGMPDAMTSVLMFMLHHYLREEAMSPRDALREAQLWMIGGGPPPESMPERLRAGLAERVRPGPETWAAFVHTGR